MEIQLKQRLVGITVIFSLAVIFLPMLLDGSGRSPKNLEISIPPPPHMNSDIRVEEKVIELKREVVDLKDLEPVLVDEISDPPDSEPVATLADTQNQPKKLAEEKKDVEKTSKEEAPVKTAKTEKKAEPKKKTISDTTKKQVGGDLWVIQVGSFQDKNKAYKERDRLRKSKLSAVFIEKFKAKKALSYRVRMGPFLTRDKASVVKNKLLAKYNMKGWLMKYEK